MLHYMKTPYKNRKVEKLYLQTKVFTVGTYIILHIKSNFSIFLGNMLMVRHWVSSYGMTLNIEISEAKLAGLSDD